MEAHFIEFLLAYRLAALFLGSVFLGDTFAIAAGFLVASNIWPFSVVVGVSLIGTLIADTVWFLLGTWVVKQRFWERYETRYVSVDRYIDRAFGENPERSLLVTKFLYGTRILSILYLSLRKTPYLSFMFYNTIGSTALIVVLVTLGWAFGAGVLTVLPDMTLVGVLLTSVVILTVVVRVVLIRLKKEVTNEAADTENR